MPAIMNPNHLAALKLAKAGRLHERHRSTRTLLQTNWVRPIHGTKFHELTERGKTVLTEHSSDTHETLT